ncbi:MAG: hypothetical protein C4560_13660 [Nitrospiraceae bacterium]|nr:MAG: hypothetical protein C4560_13660 [Nitrospiraceae bacterium]
MGLKKLFMILLLLTSFPILVSAEQRPSIMGIYDEVPGQRFVFDGKQVEVIEFLSFYCGHCYEFEKLIPVIKGNFPKKIKWKVVPVHWGKGSPKPAEAYFLAVEAGKGDEMKKALFEAFFIEKKDIGDIEVLERLGTKVGLGFDFSLRLRTGEKALNAEEAITLSRIYGIDETPTLIIAGNLKESPGMLDHNVNILRDNTILILRSILRK